VCVCGRGIHSSHSIGVVSCDVHGSPLLHDASPNSAPNPTPSFGFAGWRIEGFDWMLKVSTPVLIQYWCPTITCHNHHDDAHNIHQNIPSVSTDTLTQVRHTSTLAHEHHRHITSCARVWRPVPALNPGAASTMASLNKRLPT
jgi:hypothetical protein